MHKEQIYLAGPLFTRGEIKDRINDEKILLDNFQNKYTIFNPINWNKKHQIDSKFNNVTPIMIFEKDYKAIKNSKIMIADIDNMDAGTLVELGSFIEMKINDKSLQLYIIYTNWKGRDIVNKYVLGAIQSVANAICLSMEEVCQKIKENN